jgi:S1-C subfamily serine protease
VSYEKLSPELTAPYHASALIATFHREAPARCGAFVAGRRVVAGDEGGRAPDAKSGVAPRHTGALIATFRLRRARALRRVRRGTPPWWATHAWHQVSRCCARRPLSATVLLAPCRRAHHKAECRLLLRPAHPCDTDESLFGPHVRMSFMRASYIIVVMLLGVLPSTSQVTGNIISRVFQIRFSGMTGTTFIVDYEDRQYFVTANHVVATAGEHATVEIRGADSEWHTLDLGVLHGTDKCDDVAVLIPEVQTFSKADAIPYLSSYGFGQEAYFLGFPYGLFTSVPGKLGAVALVKHAYISAVVKCSAIYPDSSAEGGLLLLDGLNNPGFSGGPVVSPDVFEAGHILKLVGVISGYRGENQPVSLNGQELPKSSVLTNTGIILAVPIERALELIRKDRDKQDSGKPK